MEDEKKDRNRENSENGMADSRARAIGVRFIGLTLLLVFVIELSIMLFMNVYFPLPTVYHSFLDAFLLVFLFFPALYFIVYRPLLRAGSEGLYRERKVLLELSESEERFRRIAENAPDIIIHWNPLTGIEYANPVLEHITGYALDDVIGKMGFLVSKLHPDDMPSFSHLMQFLSEKKPQVRALEFRLFAKDGSVVWLDARFVPHWNDKGEILSAEIIARTITGRKKAEESLRASERLLSESQKLARVGSWEVDLKTHEARWSDELYRIHGYEPGDIEPSYEFFLSTVHPDDLNRVYEMTQKAVIQGELFEDEFRIVCPDGAVRWVHATSALLKDDTGAPSRLWGAAQDITERKEAEKALERERKKFTDEMTRLTSAVEQTADTIIITNKDGVIEYVNAAFENLSGYRREEVIGKTPSIIRSGQHDKAFYENFWDTILSGEVYQGEFINKKKNGELYFVYKTVTPVRNDKGEIINFVAVDKDVTEKKHEDENREKMVRLESLGVLAGGIAHDFNNILTAILGNVSFAKLSINSQSRTYALIDEAEKASLRAKELSRQLLTFSKGGEPVKVVASIASLVQDAARFAARGTRFKCLLSIPENLWMCEVDEGQLTQVVQNIVLNAEQAMPDGGRIYVCCENVSLDADGALPVKPGDYVRLSIQDEGAGIPPENLKRIFEPYFTTKKKGSGLGLATTYSIIKKHGGHIDVQSETGAGAKFIIFLPASEKLQGGAKADDGKVLPVGKGRILVMDDEAPIRMLLQEMLEFLGYEASFAKDGQEALNLYREERESGKPFDAVLLDLTIPGGMGGKETMERLLEINPSVKAVVSSGYSDDPVMANYKHYGFKAVVPKPYDLKKMGDVLHDVMRVNGRRK